MGAIEKLRIYRTRSTLAPPCASTGRALNAMPPIKNLRWWIAGLLAPATALNYLDRQSFPVVVGEIKGN